MINIYDLPIIDEKDNIRSLQAGHSTARKWLVERNNKKMFLKSSEHLFSYSIKEAYDKINAKINILPNIIDECVFQGKRYTLFEYIKGKNFDNMTMREVEKLADSVGYALREMSCCKLDLPKVKLENVKEECLEDIDYFFKKRVNPFKLSEDDFKKLTIAMSKSFRQEKLSLIHGDIKPENIIIYKSRFWFVDTDDMKYSYFAFNFQYTVQMMFCRRKKYSAFIKKVIKAYFKNQIPLYFYENIKFILIRKFFNRAKMFIEAGDVEGEKEFIEEFANIFEKMTKGISF